MPLKMIDHDLRAQCLETLYTATESLEFIAAALDEEDAVARGERPPNLTRAGQKSREAD